MFRGNVETKWYIARQGLLRESSAARFKNHSVQRFEQRKSLAAEYDSSHEGWVGGGRNPAGNAGTAGDNEEKARPPGVRYQTRGPKGFNRCLKKKKKRGS